MELKDMIGRRKSVRKYAAAPIDVQTVQQIRSFWENAKPLYSDITVRRN